MNVKQRRNILKGLAIAAPVAWVKPVVKGVVIPAHAFTTLCPDLTISFAASPLNVSGAGPFTHTVNVVIQNIGTADAGPFSVRVLVTGGATGTQNVASLAAGASLPLSIDAIGDSCFQPNCTISAFVDNLGQVVECDETNNSAETFLLG